MSPAPVDIAWTVTHLHDMKRKPDKPMKVEEPATPVLKAPGKAFSPGNEATIRHATDAAVHRVTAKVLKHHAGLFRRLAQ